MGDPSPLKTPDRRSESGSVIWFILLAVVLLAALTMTISRSSDTVEQSGDRERARIVASDMMRYAKGLEQSISQMRMNGIGENQISFANSTTSGYTNARCTDTSCEVFSREGGGQTYREPAAAWLDNAHSAQDHFGTLLFTGNACVPDVGNYGEGGTCSGDSATLELMMIIPFIKESICLEINRLAEIGVGGAAPPQDDATAWNSTITNARFTGLYTDATEIMDSGGILDRATTGCFEGDTVPAGGYHFFYTLIARPGG